jgi:hypothetical protein
LHAALGAARRRAFRGNLGLGRHFIADLATSSGLGFLGVVVAHDRSEIEIVDLRRLVPGMAARRAFQRAAFLAQQLRRDLKVRCAIRTGNPHSSTH